MTQRKRLWILAGVAICVAIGIYFQWVAVSVSMCATPPPPPPASPCGKEEEIAPPPQKLPLACHVATVWFKRPGQESLVPSLDSFSIGTLKEVIPILKQDETAYIQVGGYSDRKGGDQGQGEKNLRVSKKRADSVASFLKQWKIADTRIKICPYGGAYPLVPQSTPATVNENRRVELWLIWKEHDISNTLYYRPLNSRCYFLLPGGLSDDVCFQPGNHHAGSTRQDSHQY